jgi:hypothetical protein
MLTYLEDVWGGSSTCSARAASRRGVRSLYIFTHCCVTGTRRTGALLIQRINKSYLCSYILDMMCSLTSKTSGAAPVPEARVPHRGVGCPGALIDRFSHAKGYDASDDIKRSAPHKQHESCYNQMLLGYYEIK